MAFMIPSSNQVSFFWMQQKTFGMQVSAPAFAASLADTADAAARGANRPRKVLSSAVFVIVSAAPCDTLVRNFQQDLGEV